MVFLKIHQFLSAMPPLVDRVIMSMALNTEDQVSMQSVVRFCLGLDAELDLPGSAPVATFLERLQAEPVDAEEVAEKERIAETVMTFLTSTPSRRRSKTL